MGRVYGLRAWETPIGSRHSRGTHIKNLLGSLQEGGRYRDNIASLQIIGR